MTEATSDLADDAGEEGNESGLPERSTAHRSSSSESGGEAGLSLCAPGCDRAAGQAVVLPLMLAWKGSVGELLRLGCWASAAQARKGVAVVCRWEEKKRKKIGFVGIMIK